METQESTSTVDVKPESMNLEDLKAHIDTVATQQQEVVPLEKVISPEPQEPAKEQTTPESAPEQGKAVVEDKTVTFEELQKQSGIKSPDALAKSYQELRKTLTQQAQELAKLKKQETKPDVPLSSQDEILAKRIQEVGTVQALKELNEAINKPVYERMKEDNLRAKIQEMQSKPETAEFNLPEIQREIHKIVSERPQQFADNEGMIYPEALEDLFYMAKGRVGLIKAGIKPQTERQVVVPIESRTKSHSVQTPVNPLTMPLEKLREIIEAQSLKE